MNTHKPLAQPIFYDEGGRMFIEGDWFSRPLPNNVFFDEMAYPDTSYSFTTFHSEKPKGFSLGYASGNYGHGIFSAGKSGQITIGKFVVLQCTRIISNLSVTIKDHCMFSWGSVITDSWPACNTLAPAVRRQMLQRLSLSSNRHLEFLEPQPVTIEENVWVGFDAIILPGVTIGRGAVIGCKTVVTQNVPSYAVVVGNPGKVIKFLDKNDTGEVRENAIKQFV
jgi:acetyltransferase-like isoleucine patch superfamily enzyme